MSIAMSGITDRSLRLDNIKSFFRKVNNVRFYKLTSHGLFRQIRNLTQLYLNHYNELKNDEYLG